MPAATAEHRDVLRRLSIDDLRLAARRAVLEQADWAELRRLTPGDFGPGGIWHPHAVARRILDQCCLWCVNHLDSLEMARSAVRRGFAEASRQMGGLPPPAEQTRQCVEAGFQRLMGE